MSKQSKTQADWIQFQKEIRRIIVEEFNGVETPHGAYEHEIQTPYGPVGVSVSDSSSRDSYGGVMCRFRWFGARYPRHWYGWDHWKQNRHFFGGIETWSPDEVIILARRHLQRFMEDRGSGFPPQSELDRLAADEEEQRSRFREYIDELSAAGIPQ